MPPTNLMMGCYAFILVPAFVMSCRRWKTGLDASAHRPVPFSVAALEYEVEKYTERLDVYWDVTRAVKMRFDTEKISIPFPQRDVHLYFPNVQAGKRQVGQLRHSPPWAILARSTLSGRSPARSRGRTRSNMVAS